MYAKGMHLVYDGDKLLMKKKKKFGKLKSVKQLLQYGQRDINSRKLESFTITEIK